jgi:putative ABC transport system permease protein
VLTNYLKIAFRTLLKNKTYAFINIAGLAAGLMCCILLTLYVKDELIFDRHHERGDRIYRVLRETRLSDGEVRISPKASGALATALESEMPEIERAIGIATPGMLGRIRK